MTSVPTAPQLARIDDDEIERLAVTARRTAEPCEMAMHGAGVLEQFRVNP
jgi:hypothetical protein